MSHHKNIFSGLGFKPWWESMRSYTISIMSVTTLFYIYKSGEGIVTCLPDHCGVKCSEGPPMTNLKCMADLPQRWILVNFWWLSALGTFFLFLANNFWEHNPALLVAVKEFKSLYDDVSTLQYMDLPEMFNLVSSPGKLTEQRKLARTVWTGFLIQQKNSFAMWFRTRNVISLVASMTSAGSMAYSLYKVYEADTTFYCTINRNKYITEYECLYTLKYVILPVTVTLFVMSSVQCIIFFTLLRSYGILSSVDVLIDIMEQSKVGKSAHRRRFKEMSEYIRKHRTSLLEELNRPSRFQRFLSARQAKDKEFPAFYELAGGDSGKVLAELQEKMSSRTCNSTENVGCSAATIVSLVASHSKSSHSVHNGSYVR